MKLAPALAYWDYIEHATPQAGLANNLLSGELSDLQDMRLSRGVTGTLQAKWDWGEDRRVDVISLLMVDNAGFASTEVFISLLDEAENEIIVAGAGGLGDVFAYPDRTFPRHLHFLLPEPVFARTLETYVLTVDPAELSIGRVWAGPSWAPPSGIEADWDPVIVDPGEMSLSPGAQGYPRRRQKHRQWSGRISHVPRAWAIGMPDNSVLDIQQLGFHLGQTEPCILFPRTRLAGAGLDVNAIHRLGCYGHFIEPIWPKHDRGDHYTADIRFAELL
ncbi:MAG TPA: hypothetical protein PKZ76_13625 [Xanthomonadaceae bacterium]|nr:hypothetical protein [Xanthomonadaceae bacterium]